MESSGNNTVMKERKRWLFFGLPFTFTKYTLTDRKLIVDSGLFTSEQNEILLYRVLDLTLRRTLLQKIFKLGTVRVEAQDKTSPVLNILNIKNSAQFKDALSDAVETEKQRLRFRRGEVIDDSLDDGAGDGFNIL